MVIIRNFQSIKIFTYLFLCLLTSLSYGVQPSEAAKLMLGELAIKEGLTPLSTNPLWQKPKRIVLLLTRGDLKMSPEIKASFERAKQCIG